MSHQYRKSCSRHFGWINVITTLAKWLIFNKTGLLCLSRQDYDTRYLNRIWDQVTCFDFHGKLVTLSNTIINDTINSTFTLEKQVNISFNAHFSMYHKTYNYISTLRIRNHLIYYLVYLFSTQKTLPCSLQRHSIKIHNISQV